MGYKPKRKTARVGIRFELALVLFILLVIILLSWEYSMRGARTVSPYNRMMFAEAGPYYADPYWMRYSWIPWGYAYI